MAAKPEKSEYEKLLGGLEGDAFQDEVCARLASLIADFQRIPPKPSGDGGLDGLSHGHTVAYCCYGPEQEPFKVITKGLKDDIIAKFRSDLRKICELTTGPTNRLKRTKSVALPDIIAKGVKIKHIYLISSWFESHKIIGPLSTSFALFKKRSAQRFVDTDATVTIWGPKDLANRGAVDEHAMFRIEERALMARVRAATSAGVMPSSVADFDAKFEDLRKRGPALAAKVDELAKYFRKAWSMAIAIDNELASTSVSLHEALEDAREQSAVSAQLKSATKAEPFALVGEMRQEVTTRLGQNFGARLGTMTSKIADGEVGRLIGECHLDWRKE
jgi:hypothetical protein